MLTSSQQESTKQAKVPELSQFVILRTNTFCHVVKDCGLCAVVRATDCVVMGFIFFYKVKGHFFFVKVMWHFSSYKVMVKGHILCKKK